MKISNVPRLLDVCRKANRVAFLWGEKGIGKSDIVAQYCKEKKLNMIDLRLGTQEVGDLVGIPRGREVNGEYLTVYCKPEWWPTEGTQGILFLDEFNRASTADVLQAMFQLILGNKVEVDGKKKIVRKMHTHVLPEGWTVVCAGNPENSDYMVQSLDSAMLDRFVQVIVSKNSKDTISWMQKNLKDEEIWKFISQYDKALGVDEKIDINVKPTSRSWEFVDDLLSYMNEEEFNSIGSEILKGCLGEEIGNLFYKSKKDNFVRPLTAKEIMGTRDFEKLYESTIKKYLNDDGKKRIELLKVTLEDLQKNIAEKEPTEKQAENINSFMSVIPPDLVISFIEEIVKTENCKSVILKLKEPKFEPLLDNLFNSLGFDKDTIDDAMEQLRKVIEKEESEEKAKETVETK